MELGMRIRGQMSVEMMDDIMLTLDLLGLKPDKYTFEMWRDNEKIRANYMGRCIKINSFKWHKKDEGEVKLPRGKGQGT